MHGFKNMYPTYFIVAIINLINEINHKNETINFQPQQTTLSRTKFYMRIRIFYYNINEGKKNTLRSQKKTLFPLQNWARQ